MKYSEITQKISKAGMPVLWQLYAMVLIVLVISLLVISDPFIKYAIDIAIAVLSIVAIINGFFIGKKSLLPWGILLIAIILICSSFITTSLIFYGLDRYSTSVLARSFWNHHDSFIQCKLNLLI